MSDDLYGINETLIAIAKTLVTIGWTAIISCVLLIWILAKI